MNYWGAGVVWTSGGPDGSGEWYTPPAYAGDVEFTSQPSNDGTSGATIDQIHQQLQNSQPAHLSALADQWQNLYNLLDAVRTQMLTESTTLYEEKWKSGAARDAFMQAGPGAALAYLDAWMDSAIANQSALQIASSIILDYQGRIDSIWQDFQTAVKNAQHVSFGDKAYAWFFDYNLIGGSDQPDYDRKTDQDRINQLGDVQNQYNVKAQKLAWSMSQEMWQTFSSFSAGHGPLYSPPDAVVDNPMQMLPPNVPNVAGAVPAVTAHPTVPSITTPTAPAPPTMLVPTPPPTTLVPAPPVRTPAPVPVPVPIVAPVPPTVPIAPVVAPVTAPVVVPPVLVPPVSALPVLPSPVSAPAGAPSVPNPVTSPFAAPKVPTTNGLISRSGTPAAEGSMPDGNLARGMRNISRGTPGQSQPPAAGRAATRRAAGEPEIRREPGTEDLFGGKGMSAPPVLGNNRKSRGRNPLPTAVTSDEISTGLPGRADAVPPILGRPAKRVTRTSRPTVSATSAETSSDIMAPTLHAPAPPIGGADVSGLEEVPAALRTPAGSAPVRATQAAPREVINRQATRPANDNVGDRPAHVAPPTAEEAFTVETPSGGVLGGRRETEEHVVEPKAQVRAG